MTWLPSWRPRTLSWRPSKTGHRRRWAAPPPEARTRREKPTFTHRGALARGESRHGTHAARQARRLERGRGPPRADPPAHFDRAGAAVVWATAPVVPREVRARYRRVQYA